MAGETILIVDDDQDIREIITMYLEKERYQVISATNGNEALEFAFSLNPNLIILDMMIPGLDGIEVCQEIRKKQSTPIIFLSCKSTPSDKSFGLIAGGDDYMSKPFDTMELLARVKAHLRRNRMLSTNNEPLSRLIQYPGIVINPENFRVIVEDKEIILSPKEFNLLELLAKQPNKVFSNDELFRSLWGSESFGDYRTVMVHVSNIRKKIEKDPKKPEFIKTVKGVGYKFCI